MLCYPWDGKGRFFVQVLEGGVLKPLHRLFGHRAKREARFAFFRVEFSLWDRNGLPEISFLVFKRMEGQHKVDVPVAVTGLDAPPGKYARGSCRRGLVCANCPVEAKLTECEAFACEFAPCGVCPPIGGELCSFNFCSPF